MKSLLKVIVIASLIVLSTTYTVIGQFLEQGTPVKQEQYTVPITVAIRLVEDAYKNVAKDTLIAALTKQRVEDSVGFELDRRQRQQQNNTLRGKNVILKRQYYVQKEICDNVVEEANIYKKEARKIRRQRNLITFILIVTAGIAIAK